MFVRVKMVRGSLAEAEAEAARVEDRTGGTVVVGDYLAGVGAWEVWQGPPAGGFVG